jgi:hypothetical protein
LASILDFGRGLRQFQQPADPDAQRAMTAECLAGQKARLPGKVRRVVGGAACVKCDSLC